MSGFRLGRCLSLKARVPEPYPHSQKTAFRDSRSQVPKLVEALLAGGGLQDWGRSLKSDARNVSTSRSTLNQFDRGLLAAIASAQAGLVPGVFDAQNAASRPVQILNVPLVQCRTLGVHTSPSQITDVAGLI